MLINPNSVQPVTVPGPQMMASGSNAGVVTRTEPASPAQAVQGRSPVLAVALKVQQPNDPVQEDPRGTQPDPKELDQVVSQAKEYIQSVRRDLNLNYDEETGLLVIKVVDKDTEEVVRQIPAEEILAFIQNMLKLTGEREGVLLKEKA